MKESNATVVSGPGGWRGVIVSPIQPLDGSEQQVLIQLDNGPLVQAPAQALHLQQDGSYTLPLTLAQLTEHTAEAPTQGLHANGGTAERQPGAKVETAEGDTLVVPVVAEELEVNKQKVQTGGVRVRKEVHQRQEVVDQPLVREEVSIDRVPINRVVEGPLPIRHEGDTMIIPLLEEVLVVEKRLMLKEEIRITRRASETHQPQQVTLRSEEAVVEPIVGNGKQSQ